MCGILGFVAGDDCEICSRDLERMLRSLFLLSESRGREAAGLALLHGQTIDILKSAVSASKMVRSQEYRRLLDEGLRPLSEKRRSALPLAAVGHSRLVTTGTQYENRNNQPVHNDKVVLVHNGIIVNYPDIWMDYCLPARGTEVDSEVIAALIHAYCERGMALPVAVQKTFGALEGNASIAAFLANYDVLLLATNNGSLYYVSDQARSTLAFCSEKYIASSFQQQRIARRNLPKSRVVHVEAGQGCVVDLHGLDVNVFPLFPGRDVGGSVIQVPRCTGIREIAHVPGIDAAPVRLTSAQKKVGLRGVQDVERVNFLKRIHSVFKHDTAWQDSLRRCSKCILPETMPFINFDTMGTCSYCRNYRKVEVRGIQALSEQLGSVRKSPGRPDCVLGVSGGRDSLYSLHYIKRKMGMHPVAYTYDWGMVTDLARRNISRICGRLGVEHIIVSADISRKREFIRKNVSAWLKRPRLGMIPLFMAGDKQYYHHLSSVRKQLGLDLAILGENMLERTDFKTGFAGIPPYNADPNHVYTLPGLSNLRLMAYYAKEYLVNPGYINMSILDTVLAYAVYYVMPVAYLNLYNYVQWKESDIVPTLIKEYNFELSPDSCTTWRIGDGTAAFYNYIYYNTVGFTENDTLRSNQIREGHITREEALDLVRKENRPRCESIHWYLSMIGLDQHMEDVLRIIHEMPRPASL